MIWSRRYADYQLPLSEIEMYEFGQERGPVQAVVVSVAFTVAVIVGVSEVVVDTCGHV
jgi:hypothetical protein